MVKRSETMSGEFLLRHCVNWSMCDVVSRCEELLVGQCLLQLAVMKWPCLLPNGSRVEHGRTMDLGRHGLFPFTVSGRDLA